ncbi:MAG: peptidoglycan-associated lipoprotein Pal [Actinomycetota bacterium]
MKNKHWALILMMLTLLIVVSGCKKKQPPPPPPPPPKAPTATLSADPTSIQAGQSATLTWSTENADDVTLDGNKVNTSGTESVSPTQTTTYHLTAKGPGGSTDATAQVSVMQPTPTPTPAPTPPPITDEQLFNQTAQDIYFDFDKSDLRPESQQVLANLAQAMKAHPNWKVQIEGNCDERGSTEYNLALGERRADSARQQLTTDGVSADALKTISYGKEKPVCTDHNEECWQKNRRDHFTLLSH